jgi:hypothetical protein
MCNRVLSSKVVSARKAEKFQILSLARKQTERGVVGGMLCRRAPSATRYCRQGGGDDLRAHDSNSMPLRHDNRVFSINMQSFPGKSQRTESLFVRIDVPLAHVRIIGVFDKSSLPPGERVVT